MSDRPKHKTLVVTGVDKERGIVTFSSAYDRDNWSYDQFASVRSVPTLWQRIRGAWFGAVDGWRYGSE